MRHAPGFTVYAQTLVAGLQASLVQASPSLQLVQVPPRVQTARGAQLGSAQSTRPSPSLSFPSRHAASVSSLPPPPSTIRGTPASPSQIASAAQPGSMQSTKPSPSLSLPSRQSSTPCSSVLGADGL